MKYPPALLSKINKQELFKTCKMVGWKRPDKVPINKLITNYLDKVEKIPKKKLTPKIVDMYNNLVTVLGMDVKPGEIIFPDLIRCLNCEESWDIHKTPVGPLCEGCIKKFLKWGKEAEGK